MARSLLHSLTASFRTPKEKAAGKDNRKDGKRTPSDRDAEVKELARLIAKYLHELKEAPAEASSKGSKASKEPKRSPRGRGNPQREAIRAAKAEARRASRSFSVVSFPKSGRTWLRVMLDELKLPANYTHDGSGHSRTGLVEEIEPASEAYAGKTIVFLYRDPRDTVVSGYFQATKRLNTYSGSIAEFIRDPRHGLEKIIRFNMEWLQRGPVLGTFHPVTYEELRADTAGTLARIVSFVGFERPPEVLQAAIDEAAFEKLKQKEASGELPDRYGKAMMPGDDDDPQSYKVREGIVGGFRNHLDAADIAYCDEVLQRLGYPIENHSSGAA